MVTIGNSMATGLRRYSNVCRKHFSKMFNLVIGGDRVIWRAGNIGLPSSTEIIILQFSTNNIDHNKPRTIENEIIKIVSILLNKSYQIKIIITGILPTTR